MKFWIINKGPHSARVFSWRHAMALVGYGKVQEGDTIYDGNVHGGIETPIIVPPSSPHIGKTYWIFRNSWGVIFPYVIADIDEMRYRTYSLVTPIDSYIYEEEDIACLDKDNDGYYNWGIGPKPLDCPTCPDEPDGNDWNPYEGPLDEYGYCQINLPYQTGFEDDLEDGWELKNSNEYGRIQTTSSYSPLKVFPYCGNKHLTMDVNENGHYCTNKALLHANLENENEIVLSFWWKEFSDETHSADGIFFSDDAGETFEKVAALSGNNGSWEYIELDVDELADAEDLELNDNFIIKFQHYDNYKITTDGFAFDQIYLIGPSPDLRSRRCIVMPRTIEAGDPIYVSGTVYNSSNYDADSSILKYYLSEDQDFDYGSDIQLESKIIPALDASESYYFSDTIEITPAKSGSKSYETWYVLFYVDGTNNVIESNEQNNEEYVSISIDWGDKSEDKENNEPKAKSKLINNKTYDINELIIYPNPTNNSFTIEFPNKDGEEYIITIKDINGKMVYIDNVNLDKVQISTEEWSQGIYFIELIGKNVYHNKIIKH